MKRYLKYITPICIALLLSFACTGNDDEAVYSISLAETPLIVAVSDSVQAHFLVSDGSNAIDAVVEFSPSVDTIASITSDGLIYGRSPGVYSFEVSYDGRIEEFEAYIVNEEITHISADPMPIFVRTGDTNSVLIKIYDTRDMVLVYPEIPVYTRIIGEKARISSEKPQFNRFVVDGILAGYSILEASLSPDFDSEFTITDTVFVIDMPLPPGNMLF